MRFKLLTSCWCCSLIRLSSLAQESFLSAQLNEAENLYNGAQAVIALYIALGGGSK